jgi:hypothetical protein
MSEYTMSTSPLLDADLVTVRQGGQLVNFPATSLRPYVSGGTAAQVNVLATGAIALNLSTASRFKLNLIGAVTLSLVNPANSQSFQIFIAANGLTVTWPSSFTWPGGTVPTLSAAGFDVIEAISFDGGKTFAAMVRATALQSPILVEDDFVGTNGTAVESRATNIGTKTWTTNAAGAFTLNGSGKAVTTIQANGNSNVFDAGVSDFTASCAMSSYSPDNNLCVIAVLMFRYVDANNYWGIQVDPRYNRVTLYNKQGGTQFDQMYIADGTVVNNAVTAVRIDCIGPNITVWINGVQISSLVSTFNQTATKCGIYMGVNGPSGGTATFGPVKVATFGGANYNWPSFTKRAASSGAPVIPLGSAGTWDATDIANPMPFYDAVNGRWAMLLSGYTAAAHVTNGNAANSNILNLGLWTAPSIDGPWTADPANPVQLADATDGYYSFNGGAVQIAGVTYQAYVSNNGTTIRWATSSNLHTWAKQGLICSATVPASNNFWRNQGVFDPMLRVRQGSNVIEMWCCGLGGDGVKRFGMLTSSDLGATWVDQTGVIPAALPPVGLFRNDSAGEPSIYVPPGQEGQQYLISFDYVPQTQTGNPPIGRYIGQGISLDGGQTWAWRIAAGTPGTYAWENLQVFDSFVVDIGDGTLRLFHSGANTYGPSLGLNIQIGEQSAPWGFTSLLAAS